MWVRSQLDAGGLRAFPHNAKESIGKTDGPGASGGFSQSAGHGVSDNFWDPSADIFIHL